MVNARRRLDCRAARAGRIGAGANGASATAPCPTRQARRRHGRARRRDRRGQRAELVWLLEHPPLYTAGTSAKPDDADRGALSGPRDRPRRAVHLSRPGPAGGLRHARPQAPRRPTCARFVATPGGMDHPHACRLQRARRAARRPHRRLGAPARQGRRLRGQDRRDRHPREAVGDAARHRAQRRAGAVAFFRHRALRRHEARYGVTSLADLGVRASMADVDAVLRREFERLFGPMAGQTVGSTEKPPLRSARSASVPSR